MKALRYLGNGEVELFDAPIPQIQHGEVLIKVEAAGICGTDVHRYIYDKDFRGIPGHEVAGIVQDAGKSNRLKSGDRVVLNVHITCSSCTHCKEGDVIFCPELRVFGCGEGIDGGFAQYLKVPENNASILPSEISFEKGCLIFDALGTACAAALKAEIIKGDFVAVFGLGPLGMLAVLYASKMGAKVIAVDINEHRLSMAREFGALRAINPRHEDLVKVVGGMTNKIGVASVLQCTPSQEGVIAGLDILRNRGVLVQVGVVETFSANIYEKFCLKELKMVGSRNFNKNMSDMLISFAKDNEEVDRIITSKYPIREAAKAFAVAKAGQELKVVIQPNG